MAKKQQLKTVNAVIFVMKLMISPTFNYSVLTSKHFGNDGLNGGLLSQKLILDM